MQDILIVGNFVKDVYLRLDSRRNKFEKDQDGINWLDLSFDSSTHNFFSRIAFLTGSAITKEIFENFGIKSDFLSSNTREHPVYRYILCNEDQVTYFSPNKFPDNTWQEPSYIPKWIYIDRSAHLNLDFAHKLIDYLSRNPATKVATFVSRHSNLNAEYMKLILSHSTIIISDTESDVQPHILIANHGIHCQGHSAYWQKNGKDDLDTHLSAHQTAAATMFSALFNGKKSDEAVKLAATNVENSILSTTLTPDELNEILMQ